VEHSNEGFYPSLILGKPKNTNNNSPISISSMLVSSMHSQCSFPSSRPSLGVVSLTHSLRVKEGVSFIFGV
jgi:hypothetical protein